MARDNGGGTGLTYTSLLLGLSIIAAAILSFRLAGPEGPTRHTMVYLGISIFSIIASTFMLFIDYNYNNQQSDTARAFFFWDNNPIRILGQNKTIALFVWIMIAIMVIASSGALGKSVIPISNPYEAGTPLTTAELSLHSTGENVLNVGFFPMFEEFVVFMFESSIILLFMLFLGKTIGKTLSFFIGLLPAVITGALLFTLAHGVSYGADQQAYVAAFTYSVIVMTANFLTGVFASPFIHFLHNTSIVVFGYAIALSIGGMAPNMTFYLKNKLGKKVIS